VAGIRAAPTLEDDNTQVSAESGMSDPDRAAWMLKKLTDAGWIEAYMDSGTMMTAYRFTASGRQFAAPFAQRHSEIITNTQHTRSTLSHLQSFITKLRTEAISVGDLMIAAKLSGEIISDFNEIIEEIVEQRRALIASVNRKIQAAKQAGDNFFEFMEKRFIPDMFVRFSRDSVERYRNEILDLLDEIRGQSDGAKAAIEKELRLYYPHLLKPGRPSILVWVLDLIEQRLTAACDVKIPELRSQTENFIRRARVLINHLASLAFGEIDTDSVFSLIKRLSGLEAADVQAVLDDARSRPARVAIGLVNPGKGQTAGQACAAPDPHAFGKRSACPAGRAAPSLYPPGAGHGVSHRFGQYQGFCDRPVAGGPQGAGVQFHHSRCRHPFGGHPCAHGGQCRNRQAAVSG
jgi:DNA-binding ferritin-like protein